MNLRLAAALPLLGLALTASAREATEPLVQERGVQADPYKADSRLTTGRMEGFRRLWVDPEAFATALVPAAPIVVTPAPPPVPVEPTPAAEEAPTPAPAAGSVVDAAKPDVIPEATEPPPVPKPTIPSIPARGDLRVFNDTSSWAELAINGQKAARIGPFDEAWVHDVKSGQYDLTFTLANGYTWTERVATVAPTK